MPVDGPGIRAHIRSEVRYNASRRGRGIRNLGALVVAETSMARSRSGYFIFAHYWIHERQSSSVLGRLLMPNAAGLCHHSRSIVSFKQHGKR
jgi:hypothetical protein